MFALKEFGNIYTRLMNPTTDVFEKRVTELDGGVGALGVASGQSAVTLSLLNIAKAGDELVSADVADLAGLSSVAHEHGVPLILDNTVSPYLLRPFEHGVDIAVYSATKFIGGHGTSIGGVIVDSGKFAWENGKFPLVADPDPSYHGLNFVEALRPLGNVAYIIKARVTLLRDLVRRSLLSSRFSFSRGWRRSTFGCSVTPRTRSPWRGSSSINPDVSWVRYPGLESSPHHAAAKKYLPRGAGAILGFGIKGGADAGRRFIDGLSLFSHVANVGDARSLAIHPATTTHSQLSPAEQQATGVTPDFVRLSVGIEHIDDILADVDQSLGRAVGGG